MEQVLAFVSTNLPIIICLLAGIALITVEVFLPGFSVPGITGLVMLIVAIVMTWLTYGALSGLALMLVTLLLCGIVISISLKSAANGRLSKSALILKNQEDKGEEGEKSKEEMQSLLLKEGETMTMLRPSGIAVFDGVRLSVVTEGELIEKGQKVIITKIEGTQIVVKKA